jgi:hypothetical protein
VTLNPVEARIYDLLDGKLSLAGIVEMTGMSDFEVCRLLFDFIDRNLAAPVTHQPERSVPVERLTRPGAATAAGRRTTVAAVVVLALAGLAVSVLGRAPFRIPGLASPFADAAESRRKSVSLARLQRVKAALRVYGLVNGSYPPSLDELLDLRPALIGPEDLVDEEGRKFEYRPGPPFVQLIAVGEGGTPYLTLILDVGL